MSVSLKWIPIKNWKDLEGGGHAYEALRSVFGTFPMQLDGDSIPFLKGMRAADKSCETWAKLIREIEEHGKILIEAGY